MPGCGYVGDYVYIGPCPLLELVIIAAWYPQSAQRLGTSCLWLDVTGFATMFGSLVPLLLSAAAIAGALPSGSASDDASFHAFAERGLFGPISTGSAAGLAGGEIACDSPPVSSFFAGLKPPVRKTWYRFVA